MTAAAAGAVSAPETSDNGFENATTVTDGDRVTDRIGPNETHYYAVSATSGDRLAADVDGAASVSILGPDFDDIYPGIVETNGTYYLRVAGERSGTYTLRVYAGEPTANDDAEPDDLPWNATTIAPNATREGRLTAGDADWYESTIPAGIPWEVSVQTDNDAEADISTSPVGFSSGELSESSAVLYSERNMTYQVEVENTSALPTNYTLTATAREPPVNDDYEGGEESPTALEPNETVSDLRLLYDEGDYFTVNTTEGTRLNVTARSTDGTEGLRVSVTNREFNVGDGPTAVENVTEGRTKNVAVYSTRDDTVTNYSLSVTERPVPAVEDRLGGDDDRYEPNDSPENATPITPNVTLSALRIGGFRPSDVFTLPLDAGQQMTVTTTHAYQTGVSVSGPDPFSSVSRDTGSTFSVYAPVDGTYEIDVSPYSEGGGTYSLTANVSAAPPDPNEPNVPRFAAG